MIKYAFIGLVLLLTSCTEMPPPAASSSAEPGIAVATVAVDNESWPSVYEATGTVQARTSAVISARLLGYVREVKVQSGDRVRAGQLLLKLDSRDLDVESRRAAAALEEVRAAVPESDSALAAAKAGLDLAEVTFGRMQDLFQKKSVSPQEFDEAVAKRKAAQAAYEMAQARRSQLAARQARVEEEVRAAEVARSYAEVLAPFAGVVVTKPAEAGTMASPGAPLLTLEGENSYRFEAQVEESHLGSLRSGQPVRVVLDGIATPIEARISEVAPTVDPPSRTAVVKADLPARAMLRSGMFGRALFPAGQPRSLLTVPVEAIVEHGQLQSVFVAENGIAHRRLVTAGEKREGQAEVLSGLSAGERVIYPVPVSLVDGARVEVKR